MPDLREVFEMVKQQTEPDLDSWSEQERRMRLATRKRKTGAIALVAALVVVGAFLVLRELDEPGSSVGPVTNTSSSVPPVGVGSEFALVNLATGEMTGTGIVPGGSEVDASPDGAKITYVNDDVVWVANADGSSQQWFDQTHAPGGAVAPRWSPDGTKIVYQGKAAGDLIGNLFVLDVASGHVHQITHYDPVDAGLYYMAPAFSADGRSVLFTKPTAVPPRADGSHMRWDIWSVPADGGAPALVEPNAIGADPQPGGDLIAFSKIDGLENVHGLYVARSDGSNARRLVDGQIWFPRWSPDGSQIGYADDGRDGLFVVDLATGETHQVLDSSEWPEWVNKDTMIVDLSD
jgi:Tol biopolymer transport system component